MGSLKALGVAWEGLTLNKGRSVLTALGVIIGVAAVIVMLAVSAGAEAEIADQINALGANLIMIMPAMGQGGFGPQAGFGVELAYDDILAIKESVSDINGRAIDHPGR
jgi:putative ABC transport system permease protein